MGISLISLRSGVKCWIIFLKGAKANFFLGKYDFCVLVLVCLVTLVATKMLEKLGTLLQFFFSFFKIEKLVN